MTMSISEAQGDMRTGYLSGGAGIMASALAWTVAAGVTILGSAQNAVLTLLIGGMLIHPVSVLVCRLRGARGAHTKGNPMGGLAAASTFWLIFCLPLAYALGLQQPGWFFAAMLLIIGGRYLVFATLYGMRLYWMLGLSLAVAGFAMGYLAASVQIVAASGAVLEAVFAIIFLMLHRDWVRGNMPVKPEP
ncbi:DUF7010 family protein [Dokdonella sp.]|uniref:DUF7010 family protein n=1 Tax=Dokdonella sp. TaxID=2291710 RepID=UPI003C440AC5